MAFLDTWAECVFVRIKSEVNLWWVEWWAAGYCEASLVWPTAFLDMWAECLYVLRVNVCTMVWSDPMKAMTCWLLWGIPALGTSYSWSQHRVTMSELAYTWCLFEEATQKFTLEMAQMVLLWTTKNDSSSLLLMPIWKKLLRSSLSKRCKSFYSEQQRTTLTNPKQTLSLVYFWCLLKKLLRELPSKQRSPFNYERQRTTLTNPKLT